MTDNLDVTQTLGQERAHAISHISAEDEQRYSPESYQKALNNTPLSVFARAAAAYASAPPLGHLRSPDIVVSPFASQTYNSGRIIYSC